MQPSFLAKLVRRGVFAIRTYEHWGIVSFFVVVAAFYFYGLGHLPLVGPDEPRYAQVAREMLLRHDLITPTLGGRPWFEKPALLYWMMIASFKLFGVSEWAARLPAAVSGLITIVAVYRIGNRIESASFEESGIREGIRPGFWGALAAATTIGIVVFSRAASFDILLTMTTTCAFAFYVPYALEEDKSYGEERNAKRLRGYLAGFYVFIGLSLLAKGLVGLVIPIGVIAFFYLLQRRLPKAETFLSLIWGLPLALLVASTWYAPVILRHGWPFIDQFFIQHHFARYVSNKYHHHEPIYYYLVVVPLLTLPWTVFLIDGLLESRRAPSLGRFTIHGRSKDDLNRLRLFALAWFLFPLLFFSFSGSKLPGYMLPVLPAVALLVGERLWRFSADAAPVRWPLRITGVFCLLLAAVAFAYHWRTGNLRPALVYLLAAPLCIAGGYALLALSRTGQTIVLAGASLAIMVVLLHCAAPAFADLESSKRLLQLADARGYSQAVIFGMQRSDRTPEFYAAGRVVYEADGEPVMYEGPAQVVEESKRRGEVVLAFVPAKEVGQLTGMTSAQTEVIGDNIRYAIVAVNYQNSDR